MPVNLNFQSEVLNASKILKQVNFLQNAEILRFSKFELNVGITTFLLEFRNKRNAALIKGITHITLISSKTFFI